MATEKRLIDANDVIEEINDAISNIAFTSPYQNDISVMVSGMERVLDIVESASAVDAVEVVRCKDCINCSTIKSEITRDINWFCEYWKGHPKIHPMGFCSYGEKRDNG